MSYSQPPSGNQGGSDNQGSYPPGGGYPPPQGGYPPPPPPGGSYAPPPQGGYQPPPAGYPPPGGYPAPPPGGYGAGGYGPPAPAGTSVLAILSLICGILALVTFCFFFFSIPLGLAAAALGFFSMNQMRQSGQGGRGLAIAGMVTGIGGLLISVALLACGNIFANQVAPGLLTSMPDFLTSVPLTLTARPGP